MTGPYQRRNVLADLVADQRPGYCVMCDRAINKPEHENGQRARRRLCRRLACLRVYRQLYASAYFQALRQGAP